MAKPVENPNIAQKGPDIFPVPAAATRAFPIIGPVHENETTTNANAIKNIPAKPPRSLCLSILFTNDDGRTISNAPKNEAAKIINNAKIIKLNIALVESVFNAPAPNTNEIPSPKEIKIIMIDTAYAIALKRP
jgi:hypothetical protein